MDDEQSANTMKGHKSGGALPTSQIKGFPKTIPKTLTEHKLKRLNILTFINDKKEILFTKKAFKHEKERIWRQIFLKMLEFGMVSKEKDWRYVRDVSFSNWRKRAQKRLKHLATNGYRLNMDECEFLIYDILGKTPDKVVTNQEQANYAEENWIAAANEGEHLDEEESDEYMIDSDEDDDVSFDEMLFVPKIVFNENLQVEREEMEHESQCNLNLTTHRQSLAKQSLEKGGESDLMSKPEMNKLMLTKNGTPVNGHAQRHSFPLKSFASTQGNTEQHIVGNHSLKYQLMPLSDSGNFEVTSDQETELRPNSPSRYMNKFRELRLLDLEIENKVLKNRYMKLKVFQLEQSLGMEHCKEVKELEKVPSPQMKSIGAFKLSEQSNSEQVNNANHKPVSGKSTNKGRA